MNKPFTARLKILAKMALDTELAGLVEYDVISLIDHIARGFARDYSVSYNTVASYLGAAYE